MKKWLAAVPASWLAAALCTAAAMSASSALAANINFVTAGTSSTFYPISATVCQLWNDSIEGMRATATPSGGGIDNLNQALSVPCCAGRRGADRHCQREPRLSGAAGHGQL